MTEQNKKDIKRIIALLRHAEYAFSEEIEYFPESSTYSVLLSEMIYDTDLRCLAGELNAVKVSYYASLTEQWNFKRVLRIQLNGEHVV